MGLDHSHPSFINIWCRCAYVAFLQHSRSRPPPSFFQQQSLPRQKEGGVVEQGTLFWYSSAYLLSYMSREKGFRRLRKTEQLREKDEAPLDYWSSSCPDRNQLFTTLVMWESTSRGGTNCLDVELHRETDREPTSSSKPKEKGCSFKNV